jgi:hypothetical protein
MKGELSLREIYITEKCRRNQEKSGKARREEGTTVFVVSGSVLSKVEGMPSVDQIDLRDFVKFSRPDGDRHLGQ